MTQFLNNEITRLSLPTKPGLQQNASINMISFSDWHDGHSHIMHSHRDVSEIILLMYGHGRYMINYHLHDLNPGDIVLCGTEQIHDEFPSADERYGTITIGISGLLLPGLAPGQFVPKNCSPVIHQSSVFDELASLAFMIKKYGTEKDVSQENDPSLSSSLLYHLNGLFIDLVRKTAANVPAGEMKINEICLKAEDYINEHFAENITLESMAQKLFISPYYLSHLLKEETGYNFKQYLLRRRLGQSQSLLSFTKMPIGEIAAATGFSDAAYYSRIFTKYIGMPPSSFRKLRAENAPSYL